MAKEGLLDSWKNTIKYGSSLPIAISILLAVVVGLSAARCRTQIVELVTSLVRWITNTRAEVVSQNTIIGSLRALHTDPILVTLDTGKVYVGYLAAYCIDPNDERPYLRIRPVKSGYRDKDHKLHYRTEYFIFEEKEDGDYEIFGLEKLKSGAVDIHINMEHVVTISKFDFEFAEKFRTIGSHTDSSKESEPGK